jgi:hypothetical protein
MVFTTFLWQILNIFIVNNVNNIQNKNTLSIFAIITISLFLSSIINQSIFTAHGARPDVGFQDGVSDCQSRTSNALNSHSNAGHHSAEYMEAYNRGLASCGTSSSSGNTNQLVTNDNSETAPVTSVDSQQQTTSGPAPTINGNNNLTQSNETALDFNSICNILQAGLYNSCGQLVNSNGNLTPAGNTTVKCIITGAMLNVGATLLQIQPSFINNTLTNFSDPTGCGGLVKIDQLNNLLIATGNMKGIVNQLIRLIQ